MNKRRLVDQIRVQLEEERRRCLTAARAAQADATDEQNKAENKYDTRGLEASYLARGQSIQTAELEQACHLYSGLVVRDFDPSEPATVGSLVEVLDGSDRCRYFLGPAAGGLEVTVDGQEALVVTGRSQLGRSLLGRVAGDLLPAGGRILSVS